MKWLLLVAVCMVIQECCLVPPTPNPLRKPPLPVIVPRIAPYKWSEA